MIFDYIRARIFINSYLLRSCIFFLNFTCFIITLGNILFKNQQIEVQAVLNFLENLRLDFSLLVLRL